MFATINEWISSCQQVLGETAGVHAPAPGEVSNAKRLQYSSDIRTDHQLPDKYQLHEQKERLIKEHVAKQDGWMKLKNDLYNVSSYYYDKNTRLIHEIEHGVSWDNSPIPGFKVVYDDRINKHLRKLNGLESAPHMGQTGADGFILLRRSGAGMLDDLEPRVDYISGIRTNSQPPDKQYLCELGKQKDRLVQEHVAKHGWVQIEHDDFGMSSYYYDKNTNLIHAVDILLGWNNSPKPDFKVVHGTHDTHLRELNSLEPADDRFAPSAFDPFCM